jgi:inner membrane protein
VDPLTHTLLGAALATTRLRRATPLAAAALMLGANAPDVDVFSYAWGEDVALGCRRGWTHGVAALAVLPLVVTGLLLLWDRVLRRRAAGAPARGGPLLGLAALAVLTHPALDWLNSYGMRWGMPFDGRWSYGDTVFIVDPWIWLLLGVPLLATRRATPGWLAAWAVATAGLARIGWERNPSLLPPLLATAAVLLVALLWRPPPPERHPRLAALGLALAAAYVGGLLALHAAAESRVRDALAAEGRGPIAKLMVGPAPLDPLRWDVVAATPAGYLHGRFDWRARARLVLDPRALEPAERSPLWPAVRSDPAVQGFLAWARFPWIATEAAPGGPRVLLLDARYARRPTSGFAGIEVPRRRLEP